MGMVEADYPYGLGAQQSYMNRDYQANYSNAPTPRTQQPPRWWDVLEVSPAASLEVINAAYKALAMRHHPDHGGSEEAMTRINLAHEDAMHHRNAVRG